MQNPVTGSRGRGLNMTFLEEVFTPSDEAESSYVFFLIGVAHSALGASIAWVSVWAAWAFVAGYFLYQIIRDFRQGRKPWDSLADTGLVALGIITPLAIVWMAVAGAATLIRSLMRA